MSTELASNICPRPATMTEYQKCKVRWCLENAEEVLNACGTGMLQTPPVDCLETVCQMNRVK